MSKTLRFSIIVLIINIAVFVFSVDSYQKSYRSLQEAKRTYQEIKASTELQRASFLITPPAKKKRILALVNGFVLVPSQYCFTSSETGVLDLEWSLSQSPTNETVIFATYSGDMEHFYAGGTVLHIKGATMRGGVSYAIKEKYTCVEVFSQGKISLNLTGAAN